MSSNKKSLQDYIEESTKNIEEDRSVASLLLMDLLKYMNTPGEDKYVHKNFGEIAAKYLETLQRSNEQLVKIAVLLQKLEGSKDGLDKKERDDLFDLIKEG